MSDDIVARIRAATSPIYEEMLETNPAATLQDLGAVLIQRGNALLEVCDRAEAEIVRIVGDMEEELSAAMHEIRGYRSDAADQIVIGRELLQ